MGCFRALVILFFCSFSASEGEETQNTDRLVSTGELYGFQIEEHEIVTEDGYLLTIFRIPHGKHNNVTGKRVILMMHGLFGVSNNFITAETYAPSVAGYFAEHGYDVWLGNSRGNIYSRKHVKLNPNRTKFWKFSWHEIGFYDVSAMIDYMLKTTGKKKLYYIGHSQGGSVFYVLTSLRPEYQKKIAQASLLAPGGYMKHFNNTVMFELAKRHKIWTELMIDSKTYEFPPPWINLLQILQGICYDSPLKSICPNLVNIVFGGDSGETPPDYVKEYFATLTTASTMQVLHYAQNIASGQLRQYDHGKEKNLAIFGTEEPPEYPVKKIKTHIAMYYSSNDVLAFQKDIENMCDDLPRCDRKFLMRNSKWTHLDFITSENLVKEMLEPMIEYMNKFNDYSD